MKQFKLTQHTDERPVDIDSAAIFNTAALGKKKAIDDTKQDIAQEHYGSPVIQRDSAPSWLSGLLTLIEIIAVVSWTLTLFTGFMSEWIFLSTGVTLCAVCLFVLKKRYEKNQSVKG